MNDPEKFEIQEAWDNQSHRFEDPVVAAAQAERELSEYVRKHPR